LCRRQKKNVKAERGKGELGVVVAKRVLRGSRGTKTAMRAF